MNNERKPRHKPSDDGRELVNRSQLEALYRKIEANFATNSQVLGIVCDLKKIASGVTLQATHVSQAAAAMVIKAIKKDMEDLRRKCNDKGITLEMVPYVDKDGHPALSKKVEYGKIYITPADDGGVDGDKDNMWDEWIAIPLKKSYTGRDRFRWERIGSKRIDLSIIKKDVTAINGKLNELTNKLNSISTQIGNIILDKAIKPLDELKKYINSEEYISFIWRNLPRASVCQDGLMPATSFALLNMLSIWAANDHKMLGGGALGSDVVIKMLENEGVPCDELRDYFHETCTCTHKN